MMTKTKLFELLVRGKTPVDRAIFRPILMHFAARQLVEREKGRKFILSAGCEITVNTKQENLMAMREASIF